MTPATHASKGFSLVELVIVISIMGMLIGFGVPSYRRYSQTQSLRGSAENLVQTVHLQRSKAMSTGQDVVLNFNTSSPYGWTSVSQGKSFNHVLPNGIQYASTNPATLTLGRNGRVNTSGTVVFINRLGTTDTVSIQISGMAMVR
jgi:prepilin-type N-terminal cleavage/methylation domain-containing protein